MGNPIIESLQRLQPGYVMYNKEHDITIRCTIDKKDDWIKEGFEVLEQKDIRLLSKKSYS